MKHKTLFDDSAMLNNRSYLYYYNKLLALAISRFKWLNMPDTIDSRFMELITFTNGMSVFFKDDIIGYLSLKVITQGPFNVYRIPTKRRAIADNGFQARLTDKDSVIIYDNVLHTSLLEDLQLYALRLAKIDRTIDVNVNAQKTPILIRASMQQRLTLANVYKEYDGNTPVIFGEQNLDPECLDVLKTDAPYIADRLYDLKTQIWNEALTFLGISNISAVKKERMITDEVNRNLGGTFASRDTRLATRKIACEQINKMFGLNIDVEYDDLMIDDLSSVSEGGEDNE